MSGFALLGLRGFAFIFGREEDDLSTDGVGVKPYSVAPLAVLPCSADLGIEGLFGCACDHVGVKVRFVVIAFHLISPLLVVKTKNAIQRAAKGHGSCNAVAANGAGSEATREPGHTCEGIACGVKAASMKR